MTAVFDLPQSQPQIVPMDAAVLRNPTDDAFRIWNVRGAGEYEFVSKGFSQGDGFGLRKIIWLRTTLGDSQDQ